jgi:hypothetical protein
MKNSNDTIGNRTRALLACSAVPQPTAEPRAPSFVANVYCIGIRTTVPNFIEINYVVLELKPDTHITLSVIHVLSRCLT